MTTLTMRVVKGDFIVTGPKEPPRGPRLVQDPPSRLAYHGDRSRREARGSQETAPGRGASRISHQRPALSHGGASYGHRQAASGGGRGAQTKAPPGGRGKRCTLHRGLPMQRQTHRHNTIVGCTAQGRLAALDKITPHVAARHQEQHQLVGHDEAPPRRGGLAGRQGLHGASLPTPGRTTSKPAASTGRQAVGFCVGHPTGDAHEKAPPESVAKFVWEELAA
jgi:hypothetical protein